MMNVSAQQLNACSILLLAGYLSRPSTLMAIVLHLISYLIYRILILQSVVCQMQCEIHGYGDGDGVVIDWVEVKRVGVVFALVLVASYLALHYASLDPDLDYDLAYALALAHIHVHLPVLGSKEEI